MTDFNPGIEARLHLIRENRGAICVGAGPAPVLGGIDAHTAVAIVADTNDPIGRDMAEAAAGRIGVGRSQRGEEDLLIEEKRRRSCW